MAIPLRKGEIEDAYREKSREEDEDDTSDEDMEAFRRACMLAGTNPSDVNAGADERTNVVSDSDGDDSDLDDLELVRSIRQRFSIPSDDVQPLVLKPLRTLPPGASDDEEDDLETLRAIERRFSKYNSDSLKRNTQCSLDKPDLNCGNSTTLEQETAKGIDEESTRFEDAPVTPQPRESLIDIDLRNQPSSPIEWPCTESFEESTLPPKYSSFSNPKHAQMFIDAIKRNRSCQRFIRSKLIQLEARIEENKKLKERIKLMRDYQMSCKRRAGRALTLKRDPHVQLIQAQKSRNLQTSKVNDRKVRASYLGPIENSHVANYRKVLTRFELPLRKQKWSKAEKENLGKGIKQQYQEMLVQKSLELLSVSEEYSGDSHAFDDAIASITNLEITPEKIRSFLPMVDWERLASMYLTGRSGAECETRWLNCEDPLINHNSWTNIEDKNLLFILQQRGLHNWIDIASSLGTNRTPFQCLTRYQRSLNAFIMKRDWTEDDDTQLRAAVEAFGEHDWQLVASNMEGRTGTQCSNRWNKSLNPRRERVGRWAVEEDKRLKVSVTLFGAKSWNKVARFVPGRTQVQCRERWVNVLDPSLNLGEWTEEEDTKLKEAIIKYGHCWSKIAACVPLRTDSQCRRRWKVLLPHEVPMLQAVRRLQKAALISNFVDREEERPALGPGDFLPLPWGNSVPADGNGDGNVKNDENTRAKPKSKKQKDSSFDASTKNSSRRTGTKRRRRSQGREINDDVESLGGGDTIPLKRKACRTRSKNKSAESTASKEDLQFSSETVVRGKACKPHSKNKCAESATGNQDLQLPSEIDVKRKARKPRSKNKCAESVIGNEDAQLSFEPSTVPRINGNHDDMIRVKKKRTSRQRTKRDKITDMKQKHRDPSLSSDNSNSLSTPDVDDVENLGGVCVNSKRRKLPKFLSKDIKCSRGAETFGICNTSTSLKKRKVHMPRSRKVRSIVQVQMCHEITSHDKQSVFDGMDVALDGMLTTTGVHSESRFGKLTKDATHSKETMEIMDEESVTLASFLQNNGRKRSKITKNNKATSHQVPVPCPGKGKRIKLAQATQDFSTQEEQPAFDSVDVTSKRALMTADISLEGTSGNTRSMSHFENNLERIDADSTTLASFLRKKGNKRRRADIEEESNNIVLPTRRKRRKASDLPSPDTSSAQFATTE